MTLLSHIEERMRKEELFSRDRTPTRIRVLGALMYHAGASYCRGTEMLGCALRRSTTGIYHWRHCFNRPRKRGRRSPLTNRTSMPMVDASWSWPRWMSRRSNSSTWISPDHSNLDALLFLRTVLERCRGQLVVLVNRGPEYSLAFEWLECCVRQEIWAFGVLSKRCSSS